MDENPNGHPQTGQRLTRRGLLQAGAALTAVGAGALALKNGAPSILGGSLAAAGTLEEKWIKTACGLCPSGCGLVVRVAGGRAVKVEGDPLHPLNQGVCCLRGQCSLEMVYSPERLEHPRIQRGSRGSGNWQEISWDEAFEIAADKLTALRTARKAHTLALVHGEVRGQMRSMLNRFMEAYGSPNIISRDSLSVQAVRFANLLTQGINGLPVYDLTNAAYVITFGGNLLESSRNVIANLGAVAFMRRGRPQRGKLVAVHPRLGLTGMKADEWIPIRPDTYAALALGMANVIINSGLCDEAYLRNYTFGFDDFEDTQGRTRMGFKRLVLERYGLNQSAAITGIAPEVIARLAGEFATNRPAIAALPTETGELCGGNALFTAMAVHSLNALVGSIDVQGGVLVQRFPSVADWPVFKADSATEGGLAQPRIDGAGGPDLPLAPGAYQNLPGAILSGSPYALEALLLVNANPVYDLPNPARTAEAFTKIPFITSIAHTLDESAALADLVLPAATFMEAWGDDYLEGVGYAGVSLRRPVIEPVTDSRNPGDVLLNLAARIGGPVAEALPFKDYLSAVKHRLSGAPFEWSKLEENGFWAEMVYFNAPPGSEAWNDVVGRDRIAAPRDGRFDFFPRELYALQPWAPEADADYLPHFVLPPTLPDDTAQAQEYPLLLLSQPLITQTSMWSGVLPTLMEVAGLQGRVQWQSWIEINPQAAEALHLHDGDRVWVESRAGREQSVVRTYPGLWPNVVFMPAGLGHHTFVKWGRDSARALLVGSNPARLQPVERAQSVSEAISGQLAYGALRVKIYPV